MANYKALHKFKKVARLWVEQEKKPHDFGDGQMVYHAEVFLLIHIQKHQGSSLTELATILDMTKASVSEVLKKLEKKGFIIKEQSPTNASKIMINITNRGTKILEKHEKIHSVTEVNLKKYYDTLDKEKLEILEEFFSKFESFLEDIRDKDFREIINRK